ETILRDESSFAADLSTHKAGKKHNQKYDQERCRGRLPRVPGGCFTSNDTDPHIVGVVFQCAPDVAQDDRQEVGVLRHVQSLKVAEALLPDTRPGSLGVPPRALPTKIPKGRAPKPKANPKGLTSWESIRR